VNRKGGRQRHDRGLSLAAAACGQVEVGVGASVSCVRVFFQFGLEKKKP
jgi:hypothetical protein